MVSKAEAVLAAMRNHRCNLCLETRLDVSSWCVSEMKIKSRWETAGMYCPPCARKRDYTCEGELVPGESRD